jgi:hypothetical protein
MKAGLVCIIEYAPKSAKPEAGHTAFSHQEIVGAGHPDDLRIGRSVGGIKGQASARLPFNLLRPRLDR